MNTIENAVNSLKAFLADINIIGKSGEELNAESHKDLYVALMEALFDENGREIDSHVEEVEKIEGVHLNLYFEDCEETFDLHTPKGYFTFRTC